MDDLTWNTKLAQRKLQRRREFWLLILLAAVLLGFGLWHFFYACTPEYALRELQSAVRRKDSAAISRYVNLELVSSRAYDDLTRNMAFLISFGVINNVLVMIVCMSVSFLYSVFKRVPPQR